MNVHIWEVEGQSSKSGDFGGKGKLLRSASHHEPPYRVSKEEDFIMTSGMPEMKTVI